MLPAALRKQLPENQRGKLIINRGFDKCLTIYTPAEWQTETDKLNQLNTFNRRDRQFIRLYNNGATEIEIDGSSRILIPQKLKEYAALKNDIVLLGYGNRIELWAAELYSAEMEISADDFSALAEELLGTKGGAIGE